MCPQNFQEMRQHEVGFLGNRPRVFQTAHFVLSRGGEMQVAGCLRPVSSALYSPRRQLFE
jgi:hypothetical protein